MAVSEQIKILCIKLNISVSELARLYGSSPQAFSQKMKREKFTPAELKEIAKDYGITEKTASMRLSRLREKLQQYLQEKELI